MVEDSFIETRKDFQVTHYKPSFSPTTLTPQQSPPNPPCCSYACTVDSGGLSLTREVTVKYQGGNASKEFCRSSLKYLLLSPLPLSLSTRLSSILDTHKFSEPKPQRADPRTCTHGWLFKRHCCSIPWWANKNKMPLLKNKAISHFILLEKMGIAEEMHWGQVPRNFCTESQLLPEPANSHGPVDYLAVTHFSSHAWPGAPTNTCPHISAHHVYFTYMPESPEHNRPMETTC